MFQNSGKSHDKPILWGGPGSAYSARTRSYLIKKGIPFQPIFPSHQRFKEEIVPLIGYFVMPVTELTDGTLIQDSVDTVIHFERAYPDNPLIPESPLQRSIAWLLSFFGSEMMLKPAMHYRWNFLNEDKPFTEATFGHFFSSHRDMDLQRKEIAPIMAYFDGFLTDLAITEQTIPTIEASYFDLLDGLNAHFLQWPYLLGGKPSLADFGLITTLYAHLARDPYSSHQMKLHAPQVYRWTERMNETGIVDGEFPDLAPEYLPNDDLPETLLPVLDYFFTDCAPEILGMVDAFNAWTASNQELAPGTALQSTPGTLSAHPMLGTFTYALRGVEFTRQIYASALYGFQRVLDVIDALDDRGRKRLDQTVDKIGGQAVTGATLNRRINHDNYRYSLA